MTYFDPDDTDRERPKRLRGTFAERAEKERRDTPKVFQTDEFAALQREWYAKLRADGFTDIEAPENTIDENYDGLVEYAKEQRHLKVGDELAEYYTYAQQWLHVARWNTRRERFYFNEWAFGAQASDVYRNHPVDPGLSYSYYKDRMALAHKEMLAELMPTARLEDIPDPSEDSPEEYL